MNLIKPYSFLTCNDTQHWLQYSHIELTDAPADSHFSYTLYVWKLLSLYLILCLKSQKS